MLNFLSRFLYVIADQKKHLVYFIILFIFTSVIEAFGIGLLGPFIALSTNPNLIHQQSWSSNLYTKLQFSSELNFILFVGIVIFIVLCLKSLLGFLAQKAIFGFGFGQQANLRARLMKAYLKVPYTFHLKRNSASLIQNILNETFVFANGFLMPLLTSVANGTITITLIILLLKTDYQATASILALIIVFSLPLYIFRDTISYWGKKSSFLNKEIVRLINHSLGGFKETRVIGCENYFEQQMEQLAGEYKILAERYNAFSTLPRYVLEPLMIGFLVCFTAFSIVSGQNSEALTSTLGIFGFASVRLLPSVSNLLKSLTGIRRSTYVVNELYFDLKQIEEASQQEILEKINSKNSFNNFNSTFSSSAISFQDEICLQHINYAYPGASNQAIDNLSLRIKKGESIALIGKSGAGKTTLVDLILGLLVPNSGEFTVDSVPIHDRLRSWQNLVGYIPQSIFLVDDSIESNIAFGVAKSKIDPVRLQKAIEAAQLSELIEQLPNGIQTKVGERGVLLSGGQRQRIGIARALYHEREILILDEATAALDNETESLVTESIETLSKSKTMIIIAHRLTTIAHCDRVYQMENGRIIKSGSYQEVVCA